MTNYTKGRAKEYRLKHGYEGNGYICIRSAGSHSFSDLVIIDKETRRIRFIQSKPKKYPESQRKKLEQEYDWINNDFQCSFEVV